MSHAGFYCRRLFSMSDRDYLLDDKDNSMLVTRLRLILAFIVALTVAHPTFAAEEPRPDITFTISTDKTTYIPGEQIIVTCSLTNTGNVPVIVKQPNTSAYAVRFVYSSGESLTKKERVSPHLFVTPYKMGYKNANVPPPVIIELKPGETVTNSSDLFPLLSFEVLQLDQYLPAPGKYSLRALYHYKSPPEYQGGPLPTPDYSINNIESTKVPFTILDPSAREKFELSELQLVYPQYDRKTRIKNLRLFLERYPRSIYKATVLRELRSTESREGNSGAALGLYHQLLGEKLSTTTRESLAYWQAYELERVGNTKEALNILSSIKDPTIGAISGIKRQLKSLLESQPKISIPISPATSQD
jgi:hypothetical protein